jgi:hypothetical protein
VVRKPDGKRPLRRPVYQWEYNITTNLKETGCKSVGWIHLVQDRDQWQVTVNMGSIKVVISRVIELVKKEYGPSS